MQHKMGYILIGVGVILVALGVMVVLKPKQAMPDTIQQVAEPVVSAIIDPLPEANEQGSDNESPTSQQDESYAKGLAFEEFIVKCFDTNFFTVKEWRGDKQVDGVYALSLSI